MSERSYTSALATGSEISSYFIVLYTNGVDTVCPAALRPPAYGWLQEALQFATRDIHVENIAETVNNALVIPPTPPFPARSLEEHSFKLLQFFSERQQWFVSESALYETWSQLLNLVVPAIAVVGQERLQAVPRVKIALNLASLIGVKPDFHVGIRLEQLPIRENVSAPLLVDRGIETSVYVWNRPQVIARLDQDANLGPSIFDFLFFEIKSGTGSTAKARLQNATAMRLALGMVARLHEQAQAADPDHCMALSETMRQSYGVVAVVSRVEIYIMRMAGSSMPTARIWSGDLDVATDICQFLTILQRLIDTVSHRQEIIGNWLWCLRQQTGVAGIGGLSSDTESSASLSDTSPVPRRKRKHSTTNSNTPGAETSGTSSSAFEAVMKVVPECGSSVAHWREDIAKEFVVRVPSPLL